MILLVGGTWPWGEVRRSHAYELTAESALSLGLCSTPVNGRTLKKGRALA